MQFVKLDKKKKKIVHVHNFKDVEGNYTKRSDESEEVPLVELNNSLQSLAEIVVFIKSIPKDQTGQIIPFKVVISRTQQGTKSGQIFFTRIYEDLGTEMKDKTPPFRIDQPDSGESGVVILDAKQLKLMTTFIGHAEDYINGKRQQMTLAEWQDNNSGVKEGVDADEAQPALVGTEG